MVNRGRLFTCDRCDESIFMSDPATRSILTDDPNMGKIECATTDYPEKWQKIFGMDLCPMCAASFKKWREYTGKVKI